MISRKLIFATLAVALSICYIFQEVDARQPRGYDDAKGIVYTVKQTWNGRPRGAEFDGKAWNQLFKHEFDGVYGHFTENFKENYKFNDLYFKYAETFDPKFSSRANDDKLNYVPSEEVCRDLFSRTDGGVGELEHLYEIPIMDACLGIISHYTKGKFYLQEELQSRYSTKLQSFAKEDLWCISQLFFNYYNLTQKYKDQKCNLEWNQMYNRFAECRSAEMRNQAEPYASTVVVSGKEEKVDDPYVSMIYQVVRKNAIACFLETLGVLGSELVKKQKSERMVKWTRGAFGSGAAKESLDRRWPNSLMRILQIIENKRFQNKQVNLVEIQRLLAAIKNVNSMQPIYKTFTEQVENSFSDYVMSRINRKKLRKRVYANNPEEALKQIYLELCGDYARKEDGDKSYDFYTNYEQLVLPTQYPEIFAISPEDFIKSIYGDKTKPLYFAIWTCKIFNETKTITKNGVQRISFKPNFLETVRIWPMMDNRIYRPEPMDELEEYSQYAVDDASVDIFTTEDAFDDDRSNY